MLRGRLFSAPQLCTARRAPLPAGSASRAGGSGSSGGSAGEAWQLGQDLGPAAAADKLGDLGLVPDADGLFSILCPACR